MRRTNNYRRASRADERIPDAASTTLVERQNTKSPTRLNISGWSLGHRHGAAASSHMWRGSRLTRPCLLMLPLPLMLGLSPSDCARCGVFSPVCVRSME